MNEGFQLTSPVKLVIWDLDDTFWTGTLSEGEIVAIERNAEIVRTLTDRGIISSICSKNDLAPVRDRLSSLGIWDLFIFPYVAFSAKGVAVRNIIEQANLRPANVLFIDDNVLNLREAEHQCPGIMIALPEQILPHILELPETRGKDDRQRTRLQQYKKLERKINDMASATLDNSSFLRSCGIKVRLEFDIDSCFDRVVELINRSNQLNFTKRRLETPERIAEFRDQLRRYDIVSAAIHASDRYGDHGLIGYYMMFKNEQQSRLVHFVFSCRMMNMGIEQYIYERLGCPAIDVVPPTSNEICCFEKVDWIELVSLEGASGHLQDADKLLLIGSCDLTALATYCSPNRIEYVNSVRDGVMVRYDDFGFILNDHHAVVGSSDLETIPVWSKEDHVKFWDDLASSDVVIVSLSSSMKGVYLLTSDHVAVRVHPEGLGDYIDMHPTAEFLKNSSMYEVGPDTKAKLLVASLQRIDGATSAGRRYLLGANTRGEARARSRSHLDELNQYNAICRSFCADNPYWKFVPIDEIVPVDDLVDDRHYTRLGYFRLAEFINGDGTGPAAEDEKSPERPADMVDVVDLVRTGRRRSRIGLVGHQRGGLAQVKRLVKLSPVAEIVRRAIGKPVALPASESLFE